MANKILRTLIGTALLAMAAMAPAIAQSDEQRVVAITQIVEHPALDAVYQGVRDELEAQGYNDGEQVRIMHESAQGNAAIASQIARKFVGEGPDVIVAIATPSAQTMAAAARQTPVVFSAVTDPVGAKLVKSLKAPGANITGVTDMLPIERHLDLLERVGWEHAPTLLPAHLVGIVNGTREDTLPEWGWFRDGTASLFADADRIHAGLGRVRLDVPAFVELLVDGDRKEMLAGLERELREGVALDDVVDAISIAASERLQRFDPTIDGDPTIQESWLGVTHTLTYANALREAVERFDDPAVLRLVAYGARFVNNAAGVDAPVERRVGVEPGGTSADVDDVIAAIASRDPDDAASSTVRYLADGGDVLRLRDAFEDLALDDAATRPIVVTHLIKTTRAAADEQRRIGHDVLRHRPMVAVARWLASPVRERPVGRLAHEAIRFVVHGKVPKTLT